MNTLTLIGFLYLSNAVFIALWLRNSSRVIELEEENRYYFSKLIKANDKIDSLETQVKRLDTQVKRGKL